MLRKAARKIIHSVPGIRGALGERQRLQSRNAELESALTAFAKERDILSWQKSQILEEQKNARAFLSKKYLRGNGIEIGAAHMPLPVAEGVKVSYLDVAPTDEIKRRWPEIADLDLVDVTIVDEGERLNTQIHSSQDFVIANHFLEHCLDPISAIMAQYRVLRPGGHIFMALPDKRHTFDVDRPVTAYEHLLEEHKTASNKFRREHTEEYVRLAEKHKKNIDKRVDELIKSDYRPHYHVWTQFGIIELFINTIRDFKLLLSIETVVQNNHEVIVVLRKLDTSPA